MTLTRISWVERFWPKVQKTDTCWLWTASTRNGYGALHDGDRNNYAHRLSYILHHGTIPEGMEIDHLCFVRACVNPAHLELVTPEENKRRCKNRTETCRWGHEWSEENTYTDPLGYRHCLTCRRENEKGKWNDESVIPCGYCGVDFKPYFNKLSGKLTTFCSVACSNRSRVHT